MKAPRRVRAEPLVRWLATDRLVIYCQGISFIVLLPLLVFVMIHSLAIVPCSATRPQGTNCHVPQRCASTGSCAAAVQGIGSFKWQQLRCAVAIHPTLVHTTCHAATTVLPVAQCCVLITNHDVTGRRNRQAVGHITVSGRDLCCTVVCVTNWRPPSQRACE